MPYASIPAVNTISSINRTNLTYFYEFASLNDLISRATEGLVDAYIDVQLCRINYKNKTREFLAFPAVSLKTITQNVNNPLSRVKITDMTFEEGDTLHIYVTLNSRNGASIEFGGIDLE